MTEIWSRDLLGGHWLEGLDSDCAVNELRYLVIEEGLPGRDYE